MDYSNDPEPNQHPNAHDYEQLEIIYSHLDAISTIDQVLVRSSLKGREVDLNNPREWGMLAKSQGKTAVYERDFGGGEKMFTFVVWTEGVEE